MGLMSLCVHSYLHPYLLSPSYLFTLPICTSAYLPTQLPPCTTYLPNYPYAQPTYIPTPMHYLHTYPYALPTHLPLCTTYPPTPMHYLPTYPYVSHPPTQLTYPYAPTYLHSESLAQPAENVAQPEAISEVSFGNKFCKSLPYSF